MRPFVMAIRPAECLLVVLMGVIAFAHARVPQQPFVLLYLFCIVAATMLLNDWRNRLHDVAKGKSLAHNKPIQFLRWMGTFWGASLALLVFVSSANPTAFPLLCGMFLVGLVYSEARRVPLGSVTLVTLTAASPVLLPIAYGARASSVVSLYCAALMLVLGRETLHDIADQEVDRGYKKTLPIVAWDGGARFVAMLSLFSGCACAMLVSASACVGSLFVVWGLRYTMSDKKVEVVRAWVDVGLVLIIGGLVLEGLVAR